MVNVYPKKLHWISFQNGFQPEKEHQKLSGKHRKQSSFNCFLDRREICSLSRKGRTRTHSLPPEKYNNILQAYMANQTDLWRLLRRETIQESDRH